MKIKLGLSNGLNVGKLGVMGGGAVVPVTYTISGTVYDADGTTVVASATVALGSLTATSGADGTYTISNIPAGTSGSMTCTKTGYSWTAITVSAMAGNLTTQNYTNAWWAAGGCGNLCVGAYRARGAASQAASYVNLVNPGTNDLTTASAPAWDNTNGWKFTAASSHVLNTGITAAANYGLAIRFSNFTLGSDICGESGTSGNAYLSVAPKSGALSYWAQGNYTSLATVYTNGVLAVTGQKGYANGSEVVASIGAWTGSGARAITIGLRNGDGIYASFYCQAFAVYNASFATQVSALSTAMAAIP